MTNLARGMSEREATRAARRSLGVVTAIKEARRQADSLYWLETLWQDMRYGARVLRRAPRFTIAVVLVLGLGVGMTTAVFAVVDSVLLNAVPFADAQRLVELNRFGPTGGGPGQPAAMVESWRNEEALFDGVEAYVRVERVFIGGREPETMQGARVSPGLLPLLGVAPALGRGFTPDETLGTVAIIGHATWMTRFGGDAPPQADAALVSRDLADRLWPPGADPIGLLKQQVWRLDLELPVTVHALDDVVAATLAQPRFVTTLLAAFALLAVLLAGAGLYAVVAYETSVRTREIGVRVALGATRGAVIRQVLGSSLLQSVAGIVLGLLGALALARLLAPLLYGIAPTDPTTFAVAAVLLFAAAAAGAWLPARRAAATEPMMALRTE